MQETLKGFEADFVEYNLVQKEKLTLIQLAQSF